MPMAPVPAALYALRLLAHQRALAMPDHPQHWITHYDPETGERSECHCADAEDSL